MLEQQSKFACCRVFELGSSDLEASTLTTKSQLQMLHNTKTSNFIGTATQHQRLHSLTTSNVTQHHILKRFTTSKAINHHNLKRSSERLKSAEHILNNFIVAARCMLHATAWKSRLCIIIISIWEDGTPTQKSQTDLSTNNRSPYTHCISLTHNISTYLSCTHTYSLSL